MGLLSSALHGERLEACRVDVLTRRMERAKGGTKRRPLSGAMRTGRKTNAEWDAKEPPPKGHGGLRVDSLTGQRKGGAPHLKIKLNCSANG